MRRSCLQRRANRLYLRCQLRDEFATAFGSQDERFRQAAVLGRVLALHQATQSGLISSKFTAADDSAAVSLAFVVTCNVRQHTGEGAGRYREHERNDENFANHQCLKSSTAGSSSQSSRTVGGVLACYAKMSSASCNVSLDQRPGSTADDADEQRGCDRQHITQVGRSPLRGRKNSLGKTEGSTWRQWRPKIRT